MSDTFPRKWAGSNFKTPRLTEAQKRKTKRGRRDNAERKNKELVRQREKNRTRHGCRFPLCGCRGWHIEVAHLEHKGIGSDPTGERSLPEKMVAVCRQRHRENKFSIDKKRIRCQRLTAAGTNGPVSWLISVSALVRFSGDMFAHRVGHGGGIIVEGDWLVLAVEIGDVALDVLEPGILTWLKEMKF